MWNGWLKLQRSAMKFFIYNSMTFHSGLWTGRGKLQDAANKRAPSGATDDTFMQRPLVGLHQGAWLRMRLPCAWVNRGWDGRAMSSARRIPEQAAQDSAARCEREPYIHIPFNNAGVQWMREGGWVAGWWLLPFIGFAFKPNFS
uniref:HDC12791 n=1 Tax=Drosophila melanogaster TaxID=7227 RepID=Q6IKD3_DROME|nr:TPA_inf: HDC12791 [Drosophila melanogaster]